MNKLFYTSNYGQMHYVYARTASAAAKKFRERFKRLFGKWNFNEVRSVQKPLMDSKIIEERKSEIAKQMVETAGKKYAK